MLIDTEENDAYSVVYRAASRHLDYLHVYRYDIDEDETEALAEILEEIAELEEAFEELNNE